MMPVYIEMMINTIEANMEYALASVPYKSVCMCSWHKREKTKMKKINVIHTQ